MIVDSQAGETGTLDEFQIWFTPQADAVRYAYGSPVSPMTAGANAVSDPGTPGAYRGRNGEKINFLVRGNDIAGNVYGTDIYTDNSTLAKAAVHARVLRPGELAVITVTILPGQSAYVGSTLGGVISSPFGPWGGSYTISRYVPAVTSTIGSHITRAVGQDGEPLYGNTYDGEGRITSQAGGIATDKIATVRYQNAPDGGIQTTYRNRLGFDTILVHDTKYRLLGITDALGGKRSFQYNAAGDRILFIDALQRQTSFTYDANGNVASITDPAGTTTQFTYVQDNNLRFIDDALGRRSQFNYDSRNNLIEIRDAAGNRDTKTYNGNSQLTGMLLADGAGIDYVYSNGMLASAGFIGGSLPIVSRRAGAGPLMMTPEG